MTINKSLNELKPGEKGVVKALLLEESMKRRLQDIGLIMNSNVVGIGTSPLGNPSAYLIKGTVIAIRNEDSKKIQVECMSRHS